MSIQIFTIMAYQDQSEQYLEKMAWAIEERKVYVHGLDANPGFKLAR